MAEMVHMFVHGIVTKIKKKMWLPSDRDNQERVLLCEREESEESATRL